MSKIKVDLHAAVEFAQKGFEIECYVIPDKHAPNKTKKRGTIVPKDAMIGLSLEGRPPRKGKSVEWWNTLEKKLWGKDVTKTYPRSAIDKEIESLGAFSSFFSHLLNAYGLIRVVEK